MKIQHKAEVNHVEVNMLSLYSAANGNARLVYYNLNWEKPNFSTGCWIQVLLFKPKYKLSKSKECFLYWYFFPHFKV